MTAGRLRSGAITAGKGLLVLLGWCVLMGMYLAVYTHAEEDAVAVGVPPKTVETNLWDQGYVSFQGTLVDHAAITAGDELPLQTTRIWCARDKNTCSLAMADAFSNFLDLDLTVYDLDAWTDRLITFHDDSAICATSSYSIDRVAQTFTMTVKKKNPVPEYALKSPLHPCEGRLDKTLTLDDGFPVYWHKRQAFEARNGIYFHLLLIAMNVAYFGGLYWLWRRRRSKRPITP